MVLAAPWRFWTVAMAFIPDADWRWIFRGRWGVVVLSVVGALALITRARRPRAGRWGARVIIAWGVFLAAWGALEVALPRGLHHLPLALQPFVHGPTRRLAQSSKQGLLPRDWILVAGDSYAHGSGDWVSSANPWRNAPFQATHVLHSRLGRDVLSFGVSGQGSAQGLAIGPWREFEILRDRFPLEPPRLILAYFYEGNDLEDNLREAGELGSAPDTLLTADGRARLAEVIEREALAPPWWRKEVHRFRGRLFGLHAVGTALIAFTEAFTPPRRPAPLRTDPQVAPMPQNTVVLGDKMVLVDVRPRGPALGLTDRQIDASVHVFSASLAVLRLRFHGIPVGVVYIPSRIPLYRWKGPVATRTMAGQPVVDVDPDDATARSHAVALRVAAVARVQGVPFLDARPALRRAAADELIHGPRDTGHLNQRGYHALADAIMEGLQANPGLLPPPRPGRRS